MAPSVADAVAALDEIKPPQGVVLPPKEIKAILEKTAGYVARNGINFEDRIREKERTNPKFSFLSANDSYNAYYLWRLSEIKEGRGTTVAAGRAGEAPVEAEKPKGPPEPPEFHFSARMPNISAQDLEVVERSKGRSGSNSKMSKSRRKEEEVEKEKLSYAQIDWHDFVVVETVVFTEADDHTNLPPPTSLNELQFASLDQKAQMSINSTHMRIEEAMPGDDGIFDGSYAQQQYNMAPSPVPQPSYQPQYQDSRQRTSEEEEEEERIRERTEARARAQQAQAEAKGGAAPMRIKENYVPRAAARAANKQQMALCPNCNQQIPYDELDAHMRIELLDPRWKEQKAKAESRYATTNLSTQDVANNLKRLASQRSDIFDGVTGQPISEEEAARRKKAANSYDGTPLDKTDRARYEMMQNEHGVLVWGCCIPLL
ncbi:hypothetical protein EYC80_010969 [Monilinia laxa]|uniref:SURP motif domain-containing protein n=1 Tax=Monilinia laxa TaxID=61186 RepID=A0A5N6JQC7_MONLA|nr:hypothetical protein EYC80_010969 [Monilinia laxa]